MSEDRITDRVPFLESVAAGVGAYLLGYLVTYLWHGGTVGERLRGFNFVVDLLGGDPIPVWRGVGWLFYNAHFVRTHIETGLGGPRSVNFIAEADDGTLALLYLVPVVLLLVAGVLLARVEGAANPRHGAIAGASVVAGYLTPAVAGALLLSHGDAISPDPVTSVLLAGLVYPIALGGGGGAVGGVLGDA